VPDIPAVFCKQVLRSINRARCVPDRTGHRGMWRTLTDSGRCRGPAAMLGRAPRALIPKLIVRVRFSSPAPIRRPRSETMAPAWALIVLRGSAPLVPLTCQRSRVPVHSAALVVYLATYAATVLSLRSPVVVIGRMLSSRPQGRIRTGMPGAAGVSRWTVRAACSIAPVSRARVAQGGGDPVGTCDHFRPYRLGLWDGNSRGANS
jgi:hypothetical protein